MENFQESLAPSLQNHLGNSPPLMGNAWRHTHPPPPEIHTAWIARKHAAPSERLQSTFPDNRGSVKSHFLTFVRFRLRLFWVLPSRQGKITKQ